MVPVIEKPFRVIEQHELPISQRRELAIPIEGPQKDGRAVYASRGARIVVLQGTQGMDRREFAARHAY